MRDFDFAGEPFVASLAEDGFTITMPENVVKLSNVKLTLRLGNLPPSVLYEMWSMMEVDDPAEGEFREVLAQYFFDIFGSDISEGVK